ncbi:hypothetical protein R0J93_27685, partial [Pseudoalteromonas sp. SIMBA_148]
MVAKSTPPQDADSAERSRGLMARARQLLTRGGRRLTRVTLVSICLMLMMEVGGISAAHAATRVSAEV